MGNEELQKQLEELDRECDRLTQKVGDLDLQNQTLADQLNQGYSADQYQILAGKIHELEQEREGLREKVERSLPDAAELLNAIRQRNPKLKLTLKDIEAILEAMGETTS